MRNGLILVGNPLVRAAQSMMEAEFVTMSAPPIRTCDRAMSDLALVLTNALAAWSGR
jgi:hypothetical protein